MVGAAAIQEVAAAEDTHGLSQPTNVCLHYNRHHSRRGGVTGIRAQRHYGHGEMLCKLNDLILIPGAHVGQKEQTL